jgi:hypothetical protein
MSSYSSPNSSSTVPTSPSSIACSLPLSCSSTLRATYSTLRAQDSRGYDLAYKHGASGLRYQVEEGRKGSRVVLRRAMGGWAEWEDVLVENMTELVVECTGVLFKHLRLEGALVFFLSCLVRDADHDDEPLLTPTAPLQLCRTSPTSSSPTQASTAPLTPSSSPTSSAPFAPFHQRTATPNLPSSITSSIRSPNPSPNAVNNGGEAVGLGRRVGRDKRQTEGGP